MKEVTAMNMKWLRILERVGIFALMESPLAPIAPVVLHAIGEAERLAGKSGREKLDHVLAIAVDSAKAAQIKGVEVDPAEVQAAGAGAISAAIGLTNILHRAQAPPARP